MPGAGELVIMTNPDADSSLRYLLRLPIAGGLVFRTAGTWPRTKALFCYAMPPEAWPDDGEVVERIPLRSCVRRGAAIEVVADRARENRSQLVFTTGRGREMVFWQSPRRWVRVRQGVAGRGRGGSWPSTAPSWPIPVPVRLGGRPVGGRGAGPGGGRGVRPVRRGVARRHQWATAALEAGVHPNVVSDRLGHSKVSVTLDVYSHVAQAVEEEAARLVASKLLGAPVAAPPVTNP